MYDAADTLQNTDLYTIKWWLFYGVNYTPGKLGFRKKATSQLKIKQEWAG